MAQVNSGKHHRHEHEAAEGYGKHNAGRVNGLPVVELLHRMMARGEAVRLAWRGGERTGIAHDSDEFPTAVLPVIRDPLPDATSGDEDAAPTTATCEPRLRIRPRGFSWWPKLLAG